VIRTKPFVPRRQATTVPTGLPVEQVFQMTTEESTSAARNPTAATSSSDQDSHQPRHGYNLRSTNVDRGRST